MTDFLCSIVGDICLLFRLNASVQMTLMKIKHELHWLEHARRHETSQISDREKKCEAAWNELTGPQGQLSGKAAHW